MDDLSSLGAQPLMVRRRPSSISVHSDFQCGQSPLSLIVSASCRPDHISTPKMRAFARALYLASITVRHAPAH